MKLSRRACLSAASMAPAAIACSRGTEAEPSYVLVGQSPERGHRLRTGELRDRKPEARRHTRVLIVGGGVAGTAAAWQLHRDGVDDVTIVELESEAGGTARSGTLPSSAYPMGAHYLPAPGPELPELVDLLDELGLVVGRRADGTVDWLPSAICSAPTERHHIHGVWQSGLYPRMGETEAEAGEWERWQEHLRQLDDGRSRSELHDFALPVARSSARHRALDRMSMAAYLDEHDFTRWRTRWAIEYACRDDYGCSLNGTSAFAGLHHFLSRGLEERRDAYLLSFPGGNGELVRRMRERLGNAQWQLDTAAVALDPDAGTLVAHTFGPDRTTYWTADVIIWAAPRFALPYVARRDPLPRGSGSALSYAPWLVANVELARAPAGPGTPLAWDNVAIDADHLGYVVATHGRPGHARKPDGRGCVISFYQPFPADDAEALALARASLLTGDASHWGRHVVSALEGMHPGIHRDVKTVHIHRWGHAMIRPEPGVLFGDALAVAREPFGRVIPCGADTRGLALFEEAFYAGVEAAGDAMARLS